MFTLNECANETHTGRQRKLNQQSALYRKRCMIGGK